MNIVVARHHSELLIKKSRFIGVICPCQSEREALLVLQELHQQHPHASHIVYAYRIQSVDGLIARFHDAGEPSGTAGKPIYQHLEGKQLINLLVAVVRYFGGIKLGAGGLTRAYSGMAKQVIDEAQITSFIELAQAKLTLEYNQLSHLEYQLKKWEGVILHQDFANQVQVLVQLPKHNLQALRELFD